jgi:UDP-N-acetylenolpyruvoylglucosamine reductase
LHDLAILGWGGLEFGAGIPGTLGGGVISIAGAHNSDMGHVLEWLEVLDAHHRVRDQFGIELELDVELRGEWDLR